MTDADSIREALRFIDASDRETWLRMGMAIKSQLNGEGFDLWDAWSQQADSYNAKDSRDVWRSIRADGGVAIGTLFYEAKANGWRNDGGHQMPTPEDIAERRRIATERAAKEEAEIARERADTASRAAAIWQAAREAKADHPYLSRKRVSPVATLREIDAGAAAAILGYAPKSSGELLAGRLLVVPVKQGDPLSTLELIDGDKRKAALAGRGSKVGGHWATERLPDGDGAGLTLLVGEGVATMLSASAASGHPGIAALSSGNLPTVAKAMRERYPAAALVILADLVKATGEPDPHAIEAARSVGGKLAIPDFEGDRDPDTKDMNDLFILDGPEAVKRAIANASAPARDEHQPGDDDAPAGDSEGNGWPDPRPLAAKIEPENYPVDALPGTIRAAVEEVAGFVKAPVPLVASSALAALSLACQAHIDAKRAEKLHGPVSLFLLTIADSGERKSTCDGFFTRAIRDYEEAQAEAAKTALRDHKAAIEAWEAKRGGIKEKIRQLAKDGKPTAGMESALCDLERAKPEPPRIPRLLYADATPEALAYGLAKSWPSGGVVSAEAGIVFGAHAMSKDSVMRNLALLNVLWDGGNLTIDRRTAESFTVRGARLTVALQVQEATLREFFTRSGALARGTGFLARFMLAWPESTQGFRPFTEAPANWPALAAFNRRIAAILEQPAPIDEDGALTPAMLTPTTEARAAWIEYHDAIERELARGGELYDVRDVASKSADNAMRLAALFQMFESGLGAISADAFERASRVTAWHLSEARRFFGELALPAEMADAARLDSWLIEYCKRERTHLVPTREAQRLGPIRDKEKLTAALRELEELDRVKVAQEGRRKTIKVNPALVVTP
jgi:putative DNA primase/helicase